MMEPAENRQRGDCRAVFRVVDFSGVGRVLAERQMGVGAIVVDAIGAEQLSRMVFAQDDDMVEQLAAERADDTFGEWVLPGRFWCAKDFTNSEGGDGLPNETVEDAVPVAVKEASRCVEREGLEELLPGPCGGGVLSGIHVADAAAAMVQDDEAIEDPEGG